MASAVFVSFHDEDTRHDIAGFLLNPLRSRGILVFAKGESRTFDLFQAIERSRLFIVVLSKNYASSICCLRELVAICCLRELVAIINCVESSPSSVLPVFYGIHPSEVLFQNGCYEKAFSEHEERFREHKQMMEEVRRWRLALTRVAGFPGLHIKNPSLLGDLVQYAVDILGREFSTLQNETIYSRHATLGLAEPPYIGQWHNLIQIELIDNKICELPQSPDCPKLRVLLLHGNADLLDIPDSFFDHMPLLQHLDLSYTSIRDLPPSLTKLIQLKKFYLKGCDLFMEISPHIFQLKNLEELDLDGTLITHLPKDIRELINLQSLTLCFDGYHHVLSRGKKGKQISNTWTIPSGVISNLTQLNYLSLDVDPEDEQWSENVRIVLEEILGLEKLKTLSIYVPKADLLEFIPAQQYLNFRLVVGHHMRRLISRVTPELETKFKHYDHSMKFVNGVNVPKGVKMNLGRFKALYLDRHMTIKSLSDLNLRNVRRLKVCILAECNEMETIVDGSNSSDGLSLRLEFLSVFYMKNLRSICQECSPFFYLKSIALQTCPMLATIFTLYTLICLPSLEEISVEDCPKVTTLISHATPKHEKMFFLPKLRMISLRYLPNLVNIFNGLRVEHVLEEMVFYCCPKLQSLSRSELPGKYLKFIKGENMWWEALKWSVSEWGFAGRPKFFEQFFKPINVEADMMNPPAAHQETRLNEYHGRMYQEVSSSTLLMRDLHLETPLLSPSTPLSSDSSEGKTQKRKAVMNQLELNQGTKGRRLGSEAVKVIHMKSQETLDDGINWRKYGQKEILGYKYPREYYRCPHRAVHGCLARKQAQRLDEDPTTIEVIYKGNHTCTQKQNLITESGVEAEFQEQ